MKRKFLSFIANFTMATLSLVTLNEALNNMIDTTIVKDAE